MVLHRQGRNRTFHDEFNTEFSWKAAKEGSANNATMTSALYTHDSKSDITENGIDAFLTGQSATTQHELVTLRYI